MEKQEFSIKNEVFDWLEAICISIVTIVLVFSFFFRFASVEGNSMLPTLHSKDKVVLLNTWISDIKEGDVVVITQPTSVGQPIIKRVIATEGQTIDIDYKTGNVYVDGIFSSILGFDGFFVKSEYKGYWDGDKKIIEKVK